MLCGMVVCENGMGSANNLGHAMQLRLCSKPYDRLVHFQQRIAQLTCRDPQLPRWFVRVLVDFMNENAETMEANLGVAPRFWGKPSWIRVFHSGVFQDYLRVVAPPHKPKRAQLPKSPSKLAIHWIQIRMHLGIEPWRVELDSMVLRELRMRYRLVSVAFDQTLRVPGPEQTRLPHHDVNSHLSRKNIINVNYTMAQLLRVVRPDLWELYAKFIPQLVSNTQPRQNNDRWDVIMAYCRTNFHSQADVAEPISWPFLPLTPTELNSNALFNFFS